MFPVGDFRGGSSFVVGVAGQWAIQELRKKPGSITINCCSKHTYFINYFILTLLHTNSVSSIQELFLKCVDENWGGSLRFRNMKLAEGHITASEDQVFLAFVRSDKPKLFRGLQIKYVRGSDPVLKLLDDDGNIAEELSILKWNTDSVEEFLSEKLERL